MSATRTRRQLREALNALNGSYQLLGNERDEAKSTAATLKRENTRLRADYAAAQSKLDSLGYEPSIDGRLGVELGLVPPREEWQLKQGMTAHITPEEHAHIVDATVRDAVNGARRGVLTTVIKALGVKGYERHGYPSVNPTAFGITENIVGQDVDRFWADLQTAIEVREEKRVADERSATEEKVSRLSRGENPFLVSRIAVDPQDSILDPQALRDLLRGGRIQVAEPYPDFAFGSSYGTAHSKSRTHAGQPPAPDKKKPAKKKSEDKK